MNLNIRISAGSLFRRIFSRRFLKFGTVGASGTVVNLGLLYFAKEHIFTAVQQPELRLNLSLALAIFFATLNNFFGIACGHGLTASNITTGQYIFS